MKTTILILIASLSSLALLQQSSAATVPAGTPLVARTVQALSNTDALGTRVPMLLENNISVNGKVVLPAGTKLSGKVVSSRRTVSSADRLKVNITELQISGRTVPIKTTGAYQVDNENFKTARGGPVGRGAYSVPVGRRMEFRLAQPLQF